MSNCHNNGPDTVSQYDSYVTVMILYLLVGAVIYICYNCMITFWNMTFIFKWSSAILGVTFISVSTCHQVIKSLHYCTLPYKFIDMFPSMC